MAGNSLRSIFNETKGKLASSLSGLMLPRDTNVIQQKITEYLNTVCDSDSDYRQNLTQSEDYILQAALSMLNAQRDLASVLNTKPQIKIETELSQETNHDNNIRTKDIRNFSRRATDTLIGAGGGALLGGGGGALFSRIGIGWGAVFGAIAGTALALYVSTQNAKTELKAKSISTKPSVKVVDTPLKVDSLLNVIEQLCDSLDNLIDTFRSQIQRVINKYESQDKPTIEKDYRTLLEGIQSLLGYKRGHSENDAKYLSKLQDRIEELSELLDNYGLEVVDYEESKAQWFDAIESPNTTEIKMVLPAIIKQGNLALKGKIFIPKEK